MAPTKSLFSFPVKVRIYDTDLSGTVFFVNHIKWFDSVVLMELEEKLGGDYQKTMKDKGIDVAVAHVSFNYKAPLFLNDVVGIHVTGIETGRTSASFHCALYRQDTCIAEGQFVYVYVDYSTRVPVPIPEHAREQYRCLMNDTA